MKPRWLDRTLFRGPHLILVFSEKEFQSAVRALGIKEPGDGLGDCQGTVHTYQQGGRLTCIVAMPAAALTGDPLDAIGTLIHEATHVWQKVEDLHSLGDPTGRFGSESEAYAVENIAMQLICEFKRRSEMQEEKPFTARRRRVREVARAILAKPKQRK